MRLHKFFIFKKNEMKDLCCVSQDSTNRVNSLLLSFPSTIDAGRDRMCDTLYICKDTEGKK